MNITEQLRQIADDAIAALQAGNTATLPALARQTGRLANQIEGFFKNWEAPPEGIEDMVDEMDQTYMEAGDLYLEACELIEDGIEEGQEAMLQQALDKVSEAAAMLEAAAAFAQSTMLGTSES